MTEVFVQFLWLFVVCNLVLVLLLWCVTGMPQDGWDLLRHPELNVPAPSDTNAAEIPVYQS
jgi:hypothetical protein